MDLFETFSLNDLLITRQMTDLPFHKLHLVKSLLFYMPKLEKETSLGQSLPIKAFLPLRLILSLSVVTFIFSSTFVSVCLAHVSQQQEVLENFPWSTNSSSIRPQ